MEVEIDGMMRTNRIPKAGNSKEKRRVLRTKHFHEILQKHLQCAR
jgi:hypothetical protein